MEQTNIKCLEDAVRYFGEEWSDLPIIALSDSPLSSQGAQGTIIMTEVDSVIPELLNLMENGKLGICFYPNGAAHNHLIQEVRWHFVDIDEGDKGIQMERIKEAPLAPTMVYKGRKGHKLLYRIKDGKWDKSSPDLLENSIVYFKNIQQQLIEYFEGDKSVINPSRALRMPFVNNYKEFHLGKVYEEELISFNPQYVYTQEEIMNAFPQVGRKYHVRKNSSNFKEFSLEVNKNLSLFTTYLTDSNLKWTDYGDRLSFSCPIHKDSNPSAYMYKSDLIVYCSRGLADGECKVGSGKTLGWIAQHLGIDELLLAWKTLSNRTQEKYFRHINLESMSTTDAISIEQASGDYKALVSNILHNLICVMNERGIEVDYQTKYVYESILNCALDSNKSFLCASLPPGGGKSTLLREMLKYLLQQKVEQSGAIIVVERLETAKQIAKELGNYSCYEEEGGGRDIPNYVSKPAAYVMESAYTFKGCKKDLVEYSYGVCRGCEYINNCDLPKKYNTQKNFPVVIISHARLQMEKEKLKNYEFWSDFRG